MQAATGGDFCVSSVPHQGLHKLVFYKNSWKAWRKLMLPGRRVPLWQMSDLASLRDEPITDLERCCHFWLHLLPAKNNHVVLREVPNVWKYGPLPRCSQTLMFSSPLEATAAVQTHHPFKAYLVQSKKKSSPSACESEPLHVLWDSYPSVCCFLTQTGPEDTLPKAVF